MPVLASSKVMERGLLTGLARKEHPRDFGDSSPRRRMSPSRMGKGCRVLIDFLPTAAAVRAPAAPRCWRWWHQQTQVPFLFQYYPVEPANGVGGREWTVWLAQFS